MPSQYNDKLKAEYNPPHQWKLVSPLSFTTDELTEDDLLLLKKIGMENDVDFETSTITVPIGFDTNLASVPRAFWNIMSPWDVARAAVVHDFLYWNCARTWPTLADDEIGKMTWKDARAVADKIFKLAMKASEPSVPKWKIATAYRAVRLFGSKPARTIS